MKIEEVFMFKQIHNNKGFILIDSLTGLLIATLSLTIICLIITSTHTFNINNSQTHLYQLANSYADALQVINVNNWSNMVTSSDKFIEIYNSSTPHSANNVISNTLQSYSLSVDKLPQNVTVMINAKIANVNNVSSRLVHSTITVTNTKSNESVTLNKYFIRDISSNS